MGGRLFQAKLWKSIVAKRPHSVMVLCEHVWERFAQRFKQGNKFDYPLILTFLSKLSFGILSSRYIYIHIIPLCTGTNSEQQPPKDHKSLLPSQAIQLDIKQFDIKISHFPADCRMVSSSYSDFVVLFFQWLSCSLCPAFASVGWTHEVLSYAVWRYIIYPFK